MAGTKTKAEVLEEYENLKKRYDELQMLANTAYDPKNQEVLGKTKEQTMEQINKSISQLKDGLATSVADLEKKLLAEGGRLADIQKSIEVSRAVLETQYHVQTGADALKKIIEEAEKKKIELEADYTSKKLALETALQNQKRDWAREQEEYEYETKLKQKRETLLFAEQSALKEKNLADRENALKTREVEAEALRKQIEEFPKNLEKALAEKEKETTVSVKNEQAVLFNNAKKEWENAKALQEMAIQNLREKISTQEETIIKLQKDLQAAQAKAQELAVSVIRHGAYQQAKEETASPNRQETA